METRRRFALLPIFRWSGEFYRNGSYWLCMVCERKTPSGWRAMESDNELPASIRGTDTE